MFPAKSQKQGGTGFQYFFRLKPAKSWKLVPHFPTGPETYKTILKLSSLCCGSQGGDVLKGSKGGEPIPP